MASGWSTAPNATRTTSHKTPNTSGKYAIWECKPNAIEFHDYEFNPKSSKKVLGQKYHGPLTRNEKLRATHAPGMQGRFFRHRLQRKPLVSDPVCITARASRTCRDAYRDRYPSGAWKNVPGIPGECATDISTFLARGPLLTEKNYIP